MSFNVIDQYNSFVENNFIKSNDLQLDVLKKIDTIWNNNKKTNLFSKSNKNLKNIKKDLDLGFKDKLNTIKNCLEDQSKFNSLLSSLISEICFSNEMILFEISLINIFNSSKSFFSSELTLLLSEDSFL